MTRSVSVQCSWITPKGLQADIEKPVAQGEVEAKVDAFLLEQIAALMVSALRRLLQDGAAADVLSRICESILRLLGLTPTQARREVDRVATHPLLEVDGVQFPI